MSNLGQAFIHSCDEGQTLGSEARGLMERLGGLSILLNTWRESTLLHPID